MQTVVLRAVFVDLKSSAYNSIAHVIDFDNGGCHIFGQLATELAILECAWGVQTVQYLAEPDLALLNPSMRYVLDDPTNSYEIESRSLDIELVGQFQLEVADPAEQVPNVGDWMNTRCDQVSKFEFGHLIYLFTFVCSYCLLK